MRTGSGNEGHRPASATFSKQSMPARRAHLAFVETWSENLISVSWSDPTNGRYAEQPWRLCIARSRGMCALTGADILRGDRIYRPFSRGTPPVNADWTVLASALEK
ncbi:DUF3331 domain-containing protein [Paraburkholderia sp. EG285A]|uniref:DUF3331 domain-containing protein n=1 Tax=Paraburkholderia sp. EG285A TaxID=3237009 RepID=UPI0034D1ADA0